MARQRRHQLIFGAGNAGHAVGKKLGMRMAHVGDDTPVGRGDAARAVISPAADMPISITATSCSRFKRNS